MKITKIEQELGIKLSSQLRSFYLFANGVDLLKTQINLEYPLNCDIMKIFPLYLTNGLMILCKCSIVLHIYS
ncbi:MAG: hypothetical protein ACK41O_05040 [Runella zeae]